MLPLLQRDDNTDTAPSTPAPSSGIVDALMDVIRKRGKAIHSSGKQTPAPSSQLALESTSVKAWPATVQHVFSHKQKQAFNASASFINLSQKYRADFHHFLIRRTTV